MLTPDQITARVDRIARGCSSRPRRRVAYGIDDGLSGHINRTNPGSPLGTPAGGVIWDA